MMYRPPAFDWTDTHAMLALVRENAFGTFVTATPSGLAISHLPMKIDADEEGSLVLTAHFSKGNNHLEALDSGHPSTAIFHGPHAYLSPNWYETEASVPTWNYAAVRAHGNPVAITNPNRTKDILDSLVSMFENDATGNWSTDRLDEKFIQGQMKGIVAFEMPVTHLEGKAKMSQNRKPEDIAGAISGLRSSGRTLDTETAAMMDKFR